MTVTELRAVLKGAPHDARVELSVEGHCCTVRGTLRAVAASGAVIVLTDNPCEPPEPEPPPVVQYGPAVPNVVGDYSHDLLCSCHDTSHWPDRCGCRAECFDRTPA